jgi:hypothetical protein
VPPPLSVQWPRSHGCIRAGPVATRTSPPCGPESRARESARPDRSRKRKAGTGHSRNPEALICESAVTRATPSITKRERPRAPR